MKWFKHFSNASTSLKLNGLIDSKGLKGYGQYWLVLELLADKFDGSNTNIHLHLSEITAKVRVRTEPAVRELLASLADHKLLTFVNSGKFYEIDCPILFELQDRDSKYNRPVKRSIRVSSDAKNKIENKNKINTPTVPFSESIETEFVREKFNPALHLDAKKILSEVTPQENLKSITPDEIVDVWNRIMGPRGFNLASGLGGTHLSNCLEAIKFLKDETAWINLFEMAYASSYLRGTNDRGWTVTFRWLLNYDNAQKVLDGDFKDGAGVKVLFASMSNGETA